MVVKEAIGVLTGVLILAGISVAIVYGTDTARVISAAGGSFAGLVKAATLRG